MGWLGDALKSVGNATADGLTGGLTSGLSGAISGIFGGIGAKKRLKRQVDAQKQLNEQAAKLNYEYGEKAAEDAYKRQMEMYERSYQDQSYAAMCGQMEDAGLSVGLLAYRDWETDRKSTRLNSSHSAKSRMPSSA